MIRKIILGFVTMILVSGCSKEPTLKYVYHTSEFDDVVRGMGVYKNSTDKNETSIENLYVQGLINKLTALKLKEHTNCQNLEGIKIRMEQIDDFDVELDTVKCQEESKSKDKVIGISEDGKKVSVIEVD